LRMLLVHFVLLSWFRGAKSRTDRDDEPQKNVTRQEGELVLAGDPQHSSGKSQKRQKDQDKLDHPVAAGPGPLDDSMDEPSTPEGERPGRRQGTRPRQRNFRRRPGGTSWR